MMRWRLLDEVEEHNVRQATQELIQTLENTNIAKKNYTSDQNYSIKIEWKQFWRTINRETG